MHRLWCIITADCQLLFNQMYGKLDSSLPSFLQAHKKASERSNKVDLSYAAPWSTKAELSLQINGTQKPALPIAECFLSGCRAQTRALSPRLCHRGFDARIQPGSRQAGSPQLASAASPSAERSLSTTPGASNRLYLKILSALTLRCAMYRILIPLMLGQLYQSGGVY